MKGEKEEGTDSCTFKSYLTNERLPKSLHFFERQREVPLISVQVLVAGKFAIRKRRQRPSQAWIRELPERPADALTPVCCHLFPWRRWGSAAGWPQKSCCEWDRPPSRVPHGLLFQPAYALMYLGRVQ